MPSVQTANRERIDSKHLQAIHYYYSPHDQYNYYSPHDQYNIHVHSRLTCANEQEEGWVGQNTGSRKELASSTELA